MKNIEKYLEELKNENYFSDAVEFAEGKGMKEASGACISDVSRFVEWLNEEYQILDDEEKTYLKNVIRPFVDIVTSIKKMSGFCREYIVINYQENGEENEIALPILRSKTMYERMKLNKEYTLGELGL